jgi:long-chain fatty acid transport protein
MSNRSCKRNGIKALSLATMFVFSQQALAAAYALKEQSVTYLGTAFSGTASSAEDASTNWYNTAGLTELEHDQILAALTYISPKAKLYDATATFGVPVASAVTGQMPTYPTGNGLVPGMHIAYKFNRCWSFGLSIAAPFGLQIKYPGNSIARTLITHGQIVTVDISPGVAYKVNDQWSVGAAFDPTRVIATLDNATLFGGVPGYINNKATGWGYGFHVGAMYKPTKCTKMGLTYFSRMTPHLDGGVAVLNTPVSLRMTKVTTKVDFPDRLVYSLTHKYNDKWTVEADVEWTHWSVGKYIQLDWNNGANTRFNTYFKNTWRLALGTDYQYNKCWLFKAGISYEESPVQYTYRLPALPDSNRYWLAFGAKYKTGNVTIDVAYAHAWFNDAAVGLRTTLGRTLFGTYKSSANLVGAQVAWDFM